MMLGKCTTKEKEERKKKDRNHRAKI